MVCITFFLSMQLSQKEESEKGSNSADVPGKDIPAIEISDDDVVFTLYIARKILDYILFYITMHTLLLIYLLIVQAVPVSRKRELLFQNNDDVPKDVVDIPSSDEENVEPLSQKNYKLVLIYYLSYFKNYIVFFFFFFFFFYLFIFLIYIYY